MALDFVWSDDQSVDLVSLNQSDLSDLHQPLEDLRIKTGIIIDPYKTTVLNWSHAKLLSEIIDGHNQPDKFKQFRRMLLESSMQRRDLLMIGD